MRYLIYIRVSTDKQDAETQLDHCLKFIKQKDPSDFKYEVFRDKITSKKNLFDRDGGKELIRALRHGDIIIAMRLDRVARSLHETTQLIDILEKKGVDIFLVDQPGIKNKIMLGLYAGMAEEEVKLLRKRVKEKLETKRDKSERYSRFLPYGYAMHETKLVPIRDGDKIVQKRGILIPIHEEQQVLSIMQRFLEEGQSYGRIAKSLNELGYKNREGKPFQSMTVYRILQRIKTPMSEDQLQAETVAHSFR